MDDLQDYFKLYTNITKLRERVLYVKKVSHGTRNVKILICNYRITLKQTARKDYN